MKIVALGNQSLFRLGNPLLGVGDCILLKLALMEPLIVSRNVWWQKVTLRSMDRTTQILSLQQPKWLLFVFFCQWLSSVIGVSSSLTKRMLSYMAILRKRFIWSNRQVLLLRVNHQTWCVDFAGLYTDLNSPLKLGLSVFILWYSNLV